MAAPKQRKTKSRRNQRRMHIHLDSPNLSTCNNCGKPKRPHTVCKNCGFYKGRQVLNVLKDLEEEEKKKKEKQMEEQKKQKAKKKKTPSLEDLSQKKF